MDSTSCQCIICQVAKAKLNEQVSVNQFLQDCGLPNKIPSRTEYPLCRNCFADLVPGHECGSKRETLENLHRKIPPKQLEQLSSIAIKEKAAASGSGQIKLHTGGTPLTVAVGGSGGGARPKTATIDSVRRTLFSHDQMFSMKKQLHLTDRQSNVFAKDLRVVAGRNAIESGWKEVQTSQHRVLEEFYHVQNLEFSAKDAETKQDIFVSRPAVLCKDVAKLVRHVTATRNVNPAISLVKLNLDGGGDHFKLGFSLIENDSVLQSPVKKRPRASYSDGVASQQAKSTSADRMLLLAVVPDLSENFYNLQLIVDSLPSLFSVDFTVSSDLKVLNLLSGIQQSSCRHPCPYCHWQHGKVPEEQENPCMLRTLGTVRHFHEKWLQSGAKKVELMKFFNCVQRPLFRDDDSLLVLDKAPPPELHLMLGIVNHMYTAVVAEWPEIEQWPKNLGINRRFQPGFSFNGNHCRLLLKSTEKLKELRPPRKVFKFIEAFEKFGEVVHACFSHSLDRDFKIKIRQFENAYRKLGISETVKCHIVFTHLSQFLDPKDHGLALYSEQAAESIHRIFAKVWEKYCVNPRNSKYGEKLLAAVLDLNGMNLK
jgi:hypothetical protein